MARYPAGYRNVKLLMCISLLFHQDIFADSIKPMWTVSSHRGTGPNPTKAVELIKYPPPVTASVTSHVTRSILQEPVYIEPKVKREREHSQNMVMVTMGYHNCKGLHRPLSISSLILSRASSSSFVLFTPSPFSHWNSSSVSFLPTATFMNGERPKCRRYAT